MKIAIRRDHVSVTKEKPRNPNCVWSIAEAKFGKYHCFNAGMLFDIRRSAVHGDGYIWLESPQHPGYFVSIPPKYYKVKD